MPKNQLNFFSRLLLIGRNTQMSLQAASFISIPAPKNDLGNHQENHAKVC